MRDSEKMKQELLNEQDESQLEKNDFPALLISGFLMIGIPSIIMIAIIVGTVLLLFGGK